MQCCQILKGGPTRKNLWPTRKNVRCSMILSLLRFATAYGTRKIEDDPYLKDMSHYSDGCTFVDNHLVCAQKKTPHDAVRVACVGDSITAVGHTSGIAHHWPNQLEDILEQRYGNGSYSVTNLGVCGSTLQKRGRLPWWNTSAYTALVTNDWDVVFVMLGTNDAAPFAQGYWPSSNHAQCDNAVDTQLASCNLCSL